MALLEALPEETPSRAALAGEPRLTGWSAEAYMTARVHDLLLSLVCGLGGQPLDTGQVLSPMHPAKSEASAATQAPAGAQLDPTGVEALKDFVT